ncbi:hypothetical protein Tco_1204226 [Tanacetum coccineum]
MPTEMELTLEQTQQGVSYEVSNIRVNSFTMKMEILLEPTSNKLMVEHAEFDESNANMLERFYTLAGNPVKEILFKLNLPDHRIRKDGGEGNQDTNEEPDEQELKAHYMYMAKIQEVLTAGPTYDVEPLEKVHTNDDNVFSTKRLHSDQPESINDTYVVETVDTNVILDSLDIETLEGFERPFSYNVVEVWLMCKKNLQTIWKPLSSYVFKSQRLDKCSVEVSRDQMEDGRCRDMARPLGQRMGLPQNNLDLGGVVRESSKSLSLVCLVVTCHLAIRLVLDQLLPYTFASLHGSSLLIESTLITFLDFLNLDDYSDVIVVLSPEHVIWVLEADSSHFVAAVIIERSIAGLNPRCSGNENKQAWLVLTEPKDSYKYRDGDTPFQLKSDSLPHAHAQTIKTCYKYQNSRIKKAQDLNTKTSANSDIQDLPSIYQVYQGRLLASFQDDAKCEHVDQDTRSQGGKDDQD